MFSSVIVVKKWPMCTYFGLKFIFNFIFSLCNFVRCNHHHSNTVIYVFKHYFDVCIFTIHVQDINLSLTDMIISSYIMHEWLKYNQKNWNQYSILITLNDQKQSIKCTTAKERLAECQQIVFGCPKPCSPSLIKHPIYWPSDTENIWMHLLPLKESHTNRWPRPSVVTPETSIYFSIPCSFASTFHSNSSAFML